MATYNYKYKSQMFKSEALSDLYYFTEPENRSKHEMLMLFNTKFGDLSVPSENLLLPLHKFSTNRKLYIDSPFERFYQELATFPSVHRTKRIHYGESYWYSKLVPTRICEFDEEIDAFMNVPFSTAFENSYGPCVYIISKSSRLKSKAPDSLLDLDPLYIGQSGSSGRNRLRDFRDALLGVNSHNAAGRLLNRICHTKKIHPETMLATLEVTIIRVSYSAVEYDFPQFLEAGFKTKFKKAGIQLLNVK